MKKIGIIGVGIMGGPMAYNLLQAGFEVIAFDTREEALKRIVESGAIEGHSVKEIAEHSDVILLMLPNSPNIEEVVTGTGQLVQYVRKGQVVIDMSSISPIVTKKLAMLFAEKEVEMLDAPVSGGQEKAEAGTLSFMVGGKADVFENHKELFKVMGSSVTHTGEIGSGQTTKLINQIIVAGNIAILAEALTLGKKAGVDPKIIVEAIKGGLAGSQCMTDKAPRMIDSKFDPGFRLKLHLKDLANALETSRNLHVALPLTASIMEMMQSLIGDGCLDEDHSILVKYYEKLNSITLNN